jgi:putative membrane protein
MEDTKDKSEELAEDRTDFAEDRTAMAAERTFAGWMRTSFAAIGIGIAFRGLFGELDPPWLARVIATGFILLGAIFAIGAEQRACRAFRRLSTHQINAPRAPNLRWIAWSVAAGSVVLVGALWVMK